MKYLKLFDIISKYNEYIKNDPLLPNVSLISETNEIFYNALTKLDPALLEIAGTAIVYDTTASSLMTVAGDEYNTTDYPQDVYTPVGVIIMPASHSEDGYARMMSCKLMGVKTLSDGTLTYGSYDASNMTEFDNNGGIGWAVTGDQNSSSAAVNGLLARHSDFPIINVSPTISGGTGGTFYYTNMDLTNTIGSQLGTTWVPDGDSGYGWNQSGSGDSLIPSPYDSNGGINPNIRIQGTCMGVVHGSVASNMVYDYIDNTTEDNRFDIFEAAREYSTDGTNKGSWYVPSPLELAYFSARMVEIYSTMNKLNPNFDETFDALLGMTDASVDTNYLASWSSSLFSASYAWYGGLPIYMANDSVYNLNGVGFAVAAVRNI